ncbi:hypothetical protein B0H17DRAFT_1149631 [Mycena rosella]|uniref:AB hydrolase-1 domain-containing protein n=1 Tax=Mycena rosella TaxID=1033263 RepID=A0AAD7C2C3_MYCRO|nr:hypothetical protein B0H17DRAFT_1149631 [Mycena rosella]
MTPSEIESIALLTTQLTDYSKKRTIFVKVLGDGPGKPLLIVHHGAPGLSSHAEPEVSFGFLADTFCIIVIWAGADAFVLAGGSYGGFVALEPRAAASAVGRSITDRADFKAAFAEIEPLYTPPRGAPFPPPPPAFEGAPAAPAWHYVTHNAAFAQNLPNFDVRAALGRPAACRRRPPRRGRAGGLQ